MKLAPRLLAVALTVAPVAMGCARAPEDDAVAESGDELSASKLVGEYALGKGLLSTLKLERVREGATTRNVFEAHQVVACVRAPCPSVRISGKWFARGTLLRLYPTGQSPLSFDAKLTGKTLSLKDAQGNELAQLRRVEGPAWGVNAALFERGLGNLSVDITLDEVTQQSEQYPSAVSFEEALAKALDSFLHDAEDSESPLGLMSDVYEDDPCHRDTEEETLKCFLNDPETELGMLKIGESAEWGEKVSDAWIFTLYIPSLSDHGHWAVVDRAGQEATYNYGFN